MPARQFVASEDYRYGFNGKENDGEISSAGKGTQDYGFRIYYPSLGRFLSVDPITSKYPELTPYQFASNSPIWMIDIDGLEGTTYSDPLYYIWSGFGDGFISIGNWFDETFTYHNETEVSVPMKEVAVGGVSASVSSVTNTHTTVSTNFGDFLNAAKNAPQGTTTDKLPDVTKTKTEVTTGVKVEAKVEAKSANASASATYNTNGTAIKEASAGYAIWKLPEVKAQGTSSTSSDGTSTVGVGVLIGGDTKVNGGIQYESGNGNGAINIGVGGTDAGSKTTITTKAYVKIKTN